MKALIKSAPAVASIEHIETVQHRVSKEYEGFYIAPSRSSGDEITRISPDIAICSDCLKDRKHQLHRMGYPLSIVRIAGLVFPLSKNYLTIEPLRL